MEIVVGIRGILNEEVPSILWSWEEDLVNLPEWMLRSRIFCGGEHNLRLTEASPE